MNTDDLLIDIAWRIVRDWRRRRDVDPAIRRAWAVRRSHPADATGQGGSLSGLPVNGELPSNSLTPARAFDSN
jgi:hypothetical protein